MGPTLAELLFCVSSSSSTQSGLNCATSEPADNTDQPDKEVAWAWMVLGLGTNGLQMNAILNKNHASLDAASIYVTMYPCNECAKLIIQVSESTISYSAELYQRAVKSKLSLIWHLASGVSRLRGLL